MLGVPPLNARGTAVREGGHTPELGTGVFEPTTTLSDMYGDAMQVLVALLHSEDPGAA